MAFKLLALLHDTTFGLAVTKPVRENYTVREAARAIVLDANGNIAMQHVVQGDYYKLPGGGLDEGEGAYFSP